MAQETIDFSAIDKKWQKRWAESGAHETHDDSPKPKYYCLVMFPYPSGTGLHVGHWRVYVQGDVWARYKKLQGYEVLHPMGWDAFGLPAENDAIKKGIHPKAGTQRNVENIKRQLCEIGALYDWRREISTCDPEYYRWTQWIFLQMFHKGIAYKAKMPINWCPSCLCGLANEEVIAGACDRCGAQVTKKELSQWMLRITEYAGRLLADLDTLEWPEKVKTMQANWIGRSEGAEATFVAISAQDGREFPFDVFTTRPDTLFGATYVVFAPEHPMVKQICAPDRIEKVDAYIERARQASDVDRTAEKREKTGVFIGAHAINPVSGERVPVWISDYVLMGYGTGAIMAVPAHDQRDFEFATEFKLPIREVIHSDDAARDDSGNLSEAYIGEGKMIESGDFTGLPSEEGKKRVTESLVSQNKGKTTVHYKLRDWIFSRQRYWGEPIPIIHCGECGTVPVPEKDLPVVLPDVERYQPTGTGESPLAAITDWVNVQCPKCGKPAKRETDTMPQWAGSCWYFLRYADPENRNEIVSPDALKNWLPVDMYVGGIEHAILHLLYARFFTKFLYDIGAVPFDEPFSRLFNQGMILRTSEVTGRVEKMAKSKGNVVNPDALVAKYGTDSLRLYELFVGPPEADSEWNDRGIEGVHRFLRKVRNWVDGAKDTLAAQSSDDVERQTHILTKNVTERLNDFRFNTIVSAMMEYINFVTGPGKGQDLSAGSRDTFLVLLSPFAPHLAEELWEVTGHTASVFEESWPEFDPELTKTPEVELAIQVNGKVRSRLTVPVDTSREEIEALALADAKVQSQINGKSVKKVIVVPNKLVNVVIQ